MKDETHYSLLEIPETASALEIKAAYRRLMLDVHPDRLAKAPVYWQRIAEEKAKQINAAFAVLSDTQRRRLYDAKIRSDRSGSGAGSRSAAGPPPRNQRSQANPSSTPPPSEVQRTPGQPLSSVSPGARLFLSLTLGLFSFGAVVDFWEAASVGEGVFMFIFASALLFAVACLYQSRISWFLSAVRLRKPKHQLWATLGAISLILFTGKIAYSLRQINEPSPIRLSASDLSAGAPSSPVPDSRANSSVSLSAESVIPVSLPNGTEILKRRRGGGHGKFTVDNGNAEDAVVELVKVETQKAILAFYVESGKKFTEDHIGPGTYNIYYMTGVGWDAPAENSVVAGNAVRSIKPQHFRSSGTKRRGKSITTTLVSRCIQLSVEPRIHRGSIPANSAERWMGPTHNRPQPSHLIATAPQLLRRR